ncbi:MAG: hypothetical protein ACTHOP_23685 [Mesorhizobium sp.]
MEALRLSSPAAQMAFAAWCAIMALAKACAREGFGAAGLGFENFIRWPSTVRNGFFLHLV